MDGNASSTGQLVAGLDVLAVEDVAALPDEVLREQLLDLVAASHRVWAELARRVDIADRRGLSHDDGFRSVKTWLQGVGRVSGQVAHRVVKAARVLRQLPKLAAATQTGDVSPEHVQQVCRLADQVGVDHVAEVDATLADAATVLDPTDFSVVCARVRAHLDPDGRDPARDFERRALTLTPVGGMLHVRGQLDAEGGAALTTALDAVMTPPADDDERSAAQRRADALVDLARLHLAAGDLPTVGGQRPQVGVLLFPQALRPDLLARLAAAQRDSFTRTRLRQILDQQPAADNPAADPAVALFGRTSRDLQADLTTPEADTGPPAAQRKPAARGPDWSRPGWADPPFLDWHGPVPNETAQRLACDADLMRVILDPDSGMPLDVGRSHRLVPHWIRKALYARDRGCAWPGCHTPAPWSDAHHLDPWAEGGETRVDRLAPLCRHHHMLVHEGGWRLELDPTTGKVHITRPNGMPYQLPAARSQDLVT